MSITDRLYDPATWKNMDEVHSIFASLRRDDPVHYYEKDGFVPLWHISNHADIFRVSKDNDAFINAPRAVLIQTEIEDRVRTMTGGSPNLVKSLVTIDKPEHPSMRLLTQSWFMPKNLERLSSSINGSIDMAFKKARSLEGTFNFANDVALEFPMRVIMTVLGVPSNDYPLMLRLTQELFGAEDPDNKRQDVGEDVLAGLTATFLEFAAYFNALTEQRRENPADDVATIIANAKINGEPISQQDALGYYIIISTAGHDTTSYTLSEAVHQIALNPVLLEQLKADPESMSKKIAEEAIRFASPVRHFLRTATKDYELHGKTIKKDDTVILWYPSGSRDEKIFDNPFDFNPDRDTSTRHAAFGHGAHMCLGMHLARQEISMFLKRMANEVKSLSIDGDVEYSQSQFVSGVKNLPLSVEFE